MKLYFLRHGIAADPGDWNGRDADRPLTREGVARMEREARAMEDLSLDLNAIVTSPLLRARQTAEIVANRLGLRKVLTADDRLAGSFDIKGCAAILADHAGATALMLVGHEPSFSATAGQLAGNATLEIKKGALVGIELFGPASSRGTLFCLIPPKLLSALGSS